MKAKAFLRKMTKEGRERSFDCLDKALGGILGQLSGQGYIKRDGTSYTLTTNGAILIERKGGRVW